MALQPFSPQNVKQKCYFLLQFLFLKVYDITANLLSTVTFISQLLSKFYNKPTTNNEVCSMYIKYIGF